MLRFTLALVCCFAAVLLSFSPVEATSTLLANEVRADPSGDGNIFIDRMTSIELTAETISATTLTISDPAGIDAQVQNITLSSSEQSINVNSDGGFEFGEDSKSVEVIADDQVNMFGEYFDMVASKLLNITSTSDLTIDAATTAEFTGDLITADGTFNVFIDSEKANVEISTPTDIVMGADEFNLTSTGLSIEHGIYMNSPAGDISYQAKEDVELQGNFDFWGHRDVAIVADNDLSLNANDFVDVRGGEIYLASYKGNFTARSENRYIDIRAATAANINGKQNIVLQAENTFYINAQNDGFLNHGSHVDFSSDSQVTVAGSDSITINSQFASTIFNVGSEGALFTTNVIDVDAESIVIGDPALAGFLDITTSDDLTFNSNFNQDWIAGSTIQFVFEDFFSAEADQADIHLLGNDINLNAAMDAGFRTFEAGANMYIRASDADSVFSIDGSGSSTVDFDSANWIGSLFEIKTTNDDIKVSATNLYFQTGIYEFIEISTEADIVLSGDDANVYGSNLVVFGDDNVDITTDLFTLGCKEAGCDSTSIVTVGTFGITGDAGVVILEAERNFNVNAGGGADFTFDTMQVTASSEVAVLGGTILVRNTDTATFNSNDDMLWRTENSITAGTGEPLAATVQSVERTMFRSGNSMQFILEDGDFKVNGGNQLLKTDKESEDGVNGISMTATETVALTASNSSDIHFVSGNDLTFSSTDLTKVDIGAGGFTATGVESGSLSSTAANIAVSGSAVTVDSGGGVSTKAANDLVYQATNELTLLANDVIAGQASTNLLLSGTNTIDVKAGGILMGSGVGEPATFTIASGTDLDADQPGSYITVDSFDLDVTATLQAVTIKANRFFARSDSNDDITFDVAGDLTFSADNMRFEGEGWNLNAPGGFSWNGEEFVDIGFEGTLDLDSAGPVSVLSADQVSLISEKDMEFEAFNGHKLWSETITYDINNGGEWTARGNITFAPQSPPEGANIEVYSGGATSISAAKFVLFDSSDDIITDIGGWMQARSESAGVLLFTDAEFANIDIRSAGRIDYEGAQALQIKVTNITGGADDTQGVADVYFNADGSSSGYIGFETDEGGITFFSNGLLQTGVEVDDPVAGQQGILLYSKDHSQGDHWYESTRGKLDLEIEHTVQFDAPRGPILLETELQQLHRAETGKIELIAEKYKMDINAERGVTFKSGADAPPAIGDLRVDANGRVTGVAAQYIGFRSTGTNNGNGIHVEAQRGDILYATSNGKFLYGTAYDDINWQAGNNFQSVAGNDLNVLTPSGAVSIYSQRSADFEVYNGPLTIDANLGAPTATGQAVSIQAALGVNVISGADLDIYADEVIEFDAQDNIFVTANDGRVDMETDSVGSTINFLAGSSIFVDSEGGRVEPSDGVYMESQHEIVFSAALQFSINSINLVEVGRDSRPRVFFLGRGTDQQPGVQITADDDVLLDSTTDMNIEAVNRIDIEADQFLRGVTGSSLSFSGTEIDILATKGEVLFKAGEFNSQTRGSDEGPNSISFNSLVDMEFRAFGQAANDVFSILSGNQLNLSTQTDFDSEITDLDIDSPNSAILKVHKRLTVEAENGEGGYIVFDADQQLSLKSTNTQSYITTQRDGHFTIETTQENASIAVETIGSNSEIEFAAFDQLVFEADNDVSLSSQEEIRLDSNDDRVNGDDNRGDITVQAGDDIVISSTDEDVVLTGDKGVTITTIGLVDPAVGMTGHVAAPISIWSARGVEFDSNGDFLVQSTEASISMTSAEDATFTATNGEMYMYASGDGQFTSGAKMSLEGTNVYTDIGDELSFLANGKSDESPNFGIRFEAEGNNAANPNLELKADNGNARIYGNTGVLLGAGEKQGGGVAPNPHNHEWTLDKSIDIVGQGGTDTSVFVTTIDGDITLSATEAEFTATSNGNMEWSAESTTAGQGFITMTADGLEDNADYAIRFNSVADNQNVQVVTEGGSGSVIMQAHGGVYIQGTGTAGVAKITSNGLQAVTSNGIQMNAVNPFGADITINAEGNTVISGTSVEMIAPDQNTGDSTKDGVVNVFGTGQVTFTGKASVEVNAPSTVGDLALQTSERALRAGIFAVSEKDLSGSATDMTDALIELLKVRANGPFDSNVVMNAVSGQLAVTSGTGTDIDFEGNDSGVHVSSKRFNYVTSQRNVIVESQGTLTLRGDLAHSAAPTAAVSIHSGNTLSMDVGGDFDMIAGEDIIIESSAGISFQANVNDVTEVQQFGTNIFLESTGDATFSGTLGLKFTTDPDENVNSRGTMALQSVGVPVVVDHEIAGTGVIFAPQAESTERYTAMSADARLLIPALDQQIAIGADVPCEVRGEMVIVSQQINPLLCFCEDYDPGQFAPNGSTRYRCLSFPNQN